MAGKCNMSPGIDSLCLDAIWWATEGNLGYDQWDRESWRRSGWKTGTEVDCSSFVIALLNRHGYKTGGATYTGNMRAELVKNGWKVVAANGNPQKGDVLLNDSHHTALYVGGGMIVQASRGEAGHRVNGGQAGNQDGHETNWSKYYSYPWSCYLRYTGAQPASTGNTEAQERWWFGPIYCTKLQKICGTPADGEISGQDRSDSKYRANVTCCAYGKGGSQLVEHVQRKVGADPDGKWGYETSGCVQAYLIKNGFSCGAAGADHYFGSDSVHALCDSIDNKPDIWR